MGAGGSSSILAPSCLQPLRLVRFLCLDRLLSVVNLHDVPKAVVSEAAAQVAWVELHAALRETFGR